MTNIDDVAALGQRIRAEMAKAVVGQDEAVGLMLVALFSGGHVLLEGPPGTAKTLLARGFARALSLDFGRVQFTPDLMPGDILGANLFNFQTSSFTLTRGPVFCELLLADEINRAPPKTQAALLEAMQERAVTIDGETHLLGARFTVIATQNPIESQGVYPLPEAQLDRFLFKHQLDYPTLEEELRIVGENGAAAAGPGASADVAAIEVQAGAAELTAAVAAVSEVRLADELVRYVVELVRQTRVMPELESGASPRAAVALARAARARAALDGRGYAVPDDVKALALPALRHRVMLSATAQIDGTSVERVIGDMIQRVEAPR